MRPLGKADKPPAWKGSSVEHWKEYTVSLYIVNRDFMTEAHAIHKVYQTFRETAAADSLTSYLLLGNNPPPLLRFSL